MNQEFKVEKNEFTVLDAFKYFFFLLIAVFGASIVFQIVLSVISSVQGVQLTVVSESEWAQILSYVISPIVLIIYSLVYTKVRKLKLKESFSDGQKISLLPISVAIVLAIIAIFLFTPFMELVEYGFMQWGYNPDPTIPMEEKMKSSAGYFFLGILIYALLPAIAEEIVFRGVIQKSIQSRYNGFVAVFVSTLLFTLMHGALQQTAYQLIMGIMLGYIACVGGSIVYSIILHFLNNTMVLLFGCFQIVPYLSEETYYYNVFSMIFPICIFLLGVVLTGILFWVLKYLRTKNFFAYESKKRKHNKEVEIKPETKLGIKDFWRNLTYTEKVFAVMGIILIGAIWLINTISGFTSA